MASDYQISTREYAGASVAADRLQRGANAFGRRMRRLRETASLTPEELAACVAMSLVDGPAIIAAESGRALYGKALAEAVLQVLRDPPPRQNIRPANPAKVVLVGREDEMLLLHQGEGRAILYAACPEEAAAFLKAHKKYHCSSSAEWEKRLLQFRATWHSQHLEDF